MDPPWASQSPAPPWYVDPSVALQASKPQFPLAPPWFVIPQAPPSSLVTLVLPYTYKSLAVPQPSTPLALQGSSFPLVTPLSLVIPTHSTKPISSPQSCVPVAPPWPSRPYASPWFDISSTPYGWVLICHYGFWLVHTCSPFLWLSLPECNGVSRQEGAGDIWRFLQR